MKTKSVEVSLGFTLAEAQILSKIQDNLKELNKEMDKFNSEETIRQQKLKMKLLCRKSLFGLLLKVLHVFKLLLKNTSIGLKLSAYGLKKYV